MAKHPKGKSVASLELAGSWTNGDEYATNLEYIVNRTEQGYIVRAIDRFDGEEGTVYDVRHDADKSSLAFNVHWKSTGRFIRVSLQAISPNRVSYTYAYTENQMWFRKGTEPNGGTKTAPGGRHDGTRKKG